MPKHLWEVGLMIKELGFPEVIEKKLTGCVNYTRTTSTPANLLLVGCPERHLQKILEVTCLIHHIF